MAQDDANLRICVTERLVASAPRTLNPFATRLNLATVFGAPSSTLHPARKDEAISICRRLLTISVELRE